MISLELGVEVKVQTYLQADPQEGPVMVRPSLDFGIGESCACSDRRPELLLPVLTEARALRDRSSNQSRTICSGTPKSMTTKMTLKRIPASIEYSQSEVMSVVSARKSISLPR